VNVLIVPEDFRKDQFVLKPIIERMFAEIGKPHAKVLMCFDPLLGGIDQATDWERIQDILEMYPMVDIFLLLVDRDGVATRRKALDRLEAKAGALLPNDRLFLAENAWQEIEVGPLPVRRCPRNGSGPISARRSIPRKPTSFPSRRSAAWVTNRARAGRPWEERPPPSTNESYRAARKTCKHCNHDFPNGWISRNPVAVVCRSTRSLRVFASKYGEAGNGGAR
jgi:hypothetical protein